MVFALGCGDDTDDSASSGSSTTASGSGSTTAATSTTTTAGGSGSTTTTTMGGSGSTAGGGACDPAADDDECDTCVKGMCCPEATACLADMECDCFQTCADGMPASAVPMCLMMCEVAGNGFDHPVIGPILTCTSNSCLALCT